MVLLPDITVLSRRFEVCEFPSWSVGPTAGASWSGLRVHSNENEKLEVRKYGAKANAEQVKLLPFSSSGTFDQLHGLAECSKLTRMFRSNSSRMRWHQD